MQIQIEDLEKWQQAPEEGLALIYTRTQVKLERYNASNKDEKLMGDILEIHLFNKDKEYRLITSRSKRYSKGYIEYVSDFEDVEDEVYEEKILLESEYKDIQLKDNSIKVLNHISYNENGMASIDDYRLCMEV